MEQQYQPSKLSLKYKKEILAEQILKQIFEKVKVLTLQFMIQQDISKKELYENVFEKYKEQFNKEPYQNFLKFVIKNVYCLMVLRHGTA